ncbi:MAG TPA: thioredoxin-disulfide reductase [Acidimicrobiales bacterium]|nr:thioredoxin-disulfide reductase [Acidimicrobiales bacterium]
MNKAIKQVLIVGSGPAGLTAALYSARANLEPFVLEGEPTSTGDQPGGQLMLTTEVENYPGFPEGVMGPHLMSDMRAQAERFGAELVGARASALELRPGGPHLVTYANPSTGETQQVECRALVLATGARALMLGVPNERELLGHGVSTCATCDGFFFRGRNIAVIGGGDSAIEEATFLTKFADTVTVVHRRNELRASKIMQARAFANPKIKFVWDSVVLDVLGDTKVRGLRLRNLKDGSEDLLDVQGVFVAIGHSPNTELVRGQLVLDADGYVVTEAGTTATGVPGVFAAGDVADRRYRQAVTAAGSGCMAAIDAERWLEANEADAGAAGTEEFAAR